MYNISTEPWNYKWTRSVRQKLSPLVVFYILWASQVELSSPDSPVNAGDRGDEEFNPWAGNPLQEKHGSSLSISFLENPMDRRAELWFPGVTKWDTTRSNLLSTLFYVIKPHDFPVNSIMYNIYFLWNKHYLPLNGNDISKTLNYFVCSFWKCFIN